jgi:hypothetical protein
MQNAEFLGRVFERSESVVFRKIADETLLVPVRARTADLDSIYLLNEVAARIWELLDGQRTGADVRDALVREFEVSPEVAAADVAQFLQRLTACRAIQPRG